MSQLEPTGIPDSAPRSGVARWWVSWNRQISQTPSLAPVLPAGGSAGAARYHTDSAPRFGVARWLVSWSHQIPQTPPVAPVLPAGESTGAARYHTDSARRSGAARWWVSWSRLRREMTASWTSATLGTRTSANLYS